MDLIPQFTAFWTDLTTWLQNWLPLIFMGALVAVLALTLRVMPRPRIRPEEITPDSAGAVRWDDVAGVEEAKAELREVVDFLRSPERFHKLGAKVPRGILLHGPPGTGKTLLAKAAANEAGARFFAQSASSFVEMFVGLGAARIRGLFKAARKARPAIVFIDELDAVGATRGNDISGEKDQTLNQLLVEMDGFSASDDVVVIAASNLIERLDPALLRPGRFDRQIFVAPPDVEGREAILEVHARGKPLGDVRLEHVARQTSGLTGADLANICNEAAIRAGRAGRDRIDAGDFSGAIERTIAGVESRKLLTDHERRVVAYHEAGHALCSELLPGVDKLHKISIVPRGRALGYTLNLPDEDRYLKSRGELMNMLTMLLGGRAAEQIAFGDVTTGAADDLRRVHELSRAMVIDYAMGEGLGSKRLPAEDYAVSEHTRRLIDQEQQRISDLALERAIELVSENRALLDMLAERLIEQEVLDRHDIEQIVWAAGRGPRRTIDGELPVTARPGRRFSGPAPARQVAAEGDA